MIAQTSGISGDITNDDKITKDTNSLEGLVHSIKGRNLDAKPGKQFEYSNMNYDIFRFDCSKGFTSIICDLLKHTSFHSITYDTINCKGK